MRLIEEIYDSRYAKDTADLKEKEGEEGGMEMSEIITIHFNCDISM